MKIESLESVTPGAGFDAGEDLISSSVVSVSRYEQAAQRVGRSAVVVPVQMRS